MTCDMCGAAPAVSTCLMQQSRSGRSGRRLPLFMYLCSDCRATAGDTVKFEQPVRGGPGEEEGESDE